MAVMHFVLGQGRPITSYEPASHRITATKIERREATYDPNQINEHNIEQGRKAWTYLHTSDDPLEVIVEKFEAMIPSYGCGCRQGYEELKQLHPFDYSSRDEFFVSTVRLHNAVNEKLSKAVMSLDEACQVWNRPAPTDRA